MAVVAEDSIKDAMRETTMETIEEKGASGSASVTLDQANAPRQLMTAHKSQKNENNDLTRMVQVLTKEVWELRNTQVVKNGNHTPRGNHDDEFDKSWGNAKRG